MVHRTDSMEDPHTHTVEKSGRRRFMIKSEFDDTADDNPVFLSKRPKFGLSNTVEGMAIAEYNPLQEPSPLGLKLKKSPSLLDLIQMRLSHQKTPSLAKTLARKDKSTSMDKLKASNFPASLLKIGAWEYTSRYEGDLVAKCYFAKHKLVWEVLDGGLKNKIEIQWSDIMALKAKYPENEPETLDVVLARQPLFFREINPQPRKHTLWQATTDFTSGQATIHRQHFLQFPQGTLQKHFEKLMQCDPRLRFLSQQPETVLDSPYFQQMVSIFGDMGNCDSGVALKADGRFSLPGFTDTVSGPGLSSSDIDSQDIMVSSSGQKSRGHNHSRPETLASGDFSSKINETHGLNLLNQIKLPGLHPSMSVGDLVHHISDCISEQMKSNNPNHAINECQKMSILEEISEYLLNDSQTIPASEEKSIISRVNSLCCLLQTDPTGTESLPEDVTHPVISRDNRDEQGRIPNMARKESFGELLVHLPRITSLPQFLIGVPEDPSDEL